MLEIKDVVWTYSGRRIRTTPSGVVYIDMRGRSMGFSFYSRQEDRPCLKGYACIGEVHKNIKAHIKLSDAQFIFENV